MTTYTTRATIDENTPVACLPYINLNTTIPRVHADDCRCYVVMAKKDDMCEVHNIPLPKNRFCTLCDTVV